MLVEGGKTDPQCQKAFTTTGQRENIKYLIEKRGEGEFLCASMKDEKQLH